MRPNLGPMCTWNQAAEGCSVDKAARLPRFVTNMILITKLAFTHEVYFPRVKARRATLITNSNEGKLESEGNEGGVFSRNENSSFQIYSSPNTAVATPDTVLPMVIPCMEGGVASVQGKDYSPGIGALQLLVENRPHCRKRTTLQLLVKRTTQNVSRDEL